MDFYFENHGTNTYLVYAVRPEDTIDTLSLGMLANNQIPGLAQTQFSQMDSKRFIKYNITSHVSAKQFFEGTVNRRRLLGVFRGIVKALLAAEDYMIDTNSLILDLEYIFADVSTCETVLICLPVSSNDPKQRDIGAFFKNIMFTTQFDQSENCDHVAKIINYLNSTPIFSLVEFEKLLNNIEGENPHTQIKQPVVQKPLVQQPQPQIGQSTPNSAQQTVTRTISQSIQQTSQQMSELSMAPKQKASQIPLTSKVESVNIPREKEISWFYLMQHYNKENAASYKAQKEAKKRTAGKKVPPSTPQSPKHNVPVSIPSGDSGVGFAVPGQQSSVQQMSAQRSVQQPAQQTVQQKVQEQQPVSQPVYTQHYVPQGQPMNFGETTVLGGGGIGETTVLGASPMTRVNPHLIRAKNNEKIDLNKPVFRIGKEKSYVDYFVGDNSAISRSHANIISRDGEYFVVDTNSTNHTYVNGQMIQSSMETKISHGAKIKLANEDFEFRLY